MMTQLFVAILATLAVLPAEAGNFGYGCACTSDRSPGICALRIAAIRRTTGFNTLNAGATITGNPCHSAVGFSLQTLCCKSCCDLFGGVRQAPKDQFFIGSAIANRPCHDQTHMAAWCRVVSARADFTTRCTRGKAGWPVDVLWPRRCAASCGYCTVNQQTSMFSTSQPCRGFDTCHNTSDCNVRDATTFQCTHTGAIARADDLTNADATLRYGRWNNGGECDCAQCAGRRGQTCTTDADCGDMPHACQAVNGTCDCSGCILNAFCTSDRDCGGFVGACMYKSQTAAQIDLPYLCTSTGRGPLNEECSCLWCPDNTQPCRAQGLAADCGTAATVCGALEHCYLATADVDALSTTTRCQANTPAATACTCNCRPSTAVAARDTAEAVATSILYANTNAGPGLCVQDTPCYFAAGGAFCGEIMVAGQVACVQTGSLTTRCLATAAGAACYCNCANLGTLAMPPSECEGLIVDAAGTRTACTMGGIEGQCSFEAAGTTVGARVTNMCKPDASSQQCVCGSRIDTKWSSYVGLGCLTSAQCQDTDRTTDLSAVCDATTLLCVLATADAVAGSVYGTATYTPAVIAPCTVDADCGWGTCVTFDFTAACSGETNCRCQAAGCFTASGTGATRLYQPCGLDISTSTCGGLTNACTGACRSDTAGGTCATV